MRKRMNIEEKSTILKQWPRITIIHACSTLVERRKSQPANGFRRSVFSEPKYTAKLKKPFAYLYNTIIIIIIFV